MSDLFNLTRPSFEKVYACMGVHTEVHNANFNLDPTKFLDSIQVLSNLGNESIKATVPSALDIFYRKVDGKYVLREGEFASYNEGRVLFFNNSSQDIELKAPDDFEDYIKFRNFTPLLKKYSL